MPATAADEPPAAGTPPTRRLPRADRREQILDAATRAFARTGYAATTLDDLADEAGISRVLLYRHFDSKNAMYRAVLDRACDRIAASVGTDDFVDGSIAALVHAASADPDGFRLLFRHAVREPEFTDITEPLAAASTEVAHRHLTDRIDDDDWASWAAQLVPKVTLEAVMAWLDAGQPDPQEAADRIGQAVHGVIAAAQ